MPPLCRRECTFFMRGVGQKGRRNQALGACENPWTSTEVSKDARSLGPHLLGTRNMIRRPGIPEGSQAAIPMTPSAHLHLGWALEREPHTRTKRALTSHRGAES